MCCENIRDLQLLVSDQIPSLKIQRGAQEAVGRRRRILVTDVRLRKVSQLHRQPAIVVATALRTASQLGVWFTAAPPASSRSGHCPAHSLTVGCTSAQCVSIRLPAAPPASYRSGHCPAHSLTVGCVHAHRVFRFACQPRCAEAPRLRCGTQCVSAGATQALCSITSTPGREAAWRAHTA